MPAFDQSNTEYQPNFWYPIIQCISINSDIYTSPRPDIHTYSWTIRRVLKIYELIVTDFSWQLWITRVCQSSMSISTQNNSTPLNSSFRRTDCIYYTRCSNGGGGSGARAYRSFNCIFTIAYVINYFFPLPSPSKCLYF